MKTLYPAIFALSLLAFLGLGCATTDPNGVPLVTGPATEGQRNADGLIVAMPNFYPLTYNPEGLTPQTLTTISGDAIEFRNSDLKPHWPAVVGTPELTAPAALQPGEVWRVPVVTRGSFQFVDKNKSADSRWHLTVEVR